MEFLGISLNMSVGVCKAIQMGCVSSLEMSSPQAHCILDIRGCRTGCTLHASGKSEHSLPGRGAFMEEKECIPM